MIIKAIILTIYDFHTHIQSFIHHFTGLFRAKIWLVSSAGRALHRYRRVQIPYRLEFIIFLALFSLMFKKSSLPRRSLPFSKMIIIVMIMTRVARLVIMFVIGLAGCQEMR